MFKELVNNIKDKVGDMQKANEEYQQQLLNSATMPQLSQIPNVKNENLKISGELVTEICPNIPVQKGNIITNLIPINELMLIVIYAKEVKTNKEYYIIPTTSYLWIMNDTSYIRYNYENLVIKVLKSGLMSKSVNLLNVIFELSGENTQIDYLVNVINNQEFRTQEITKKVSTLCGTNPIKRNINRIETGISVDQNKNVVFHTKTFNQVFNIKDIDNFELMLDNNVLQEKRTKMQTRITAGKSSCYEIKIRVTITDGRTFVLPILPRSQFDQLYQSTSEKYLKNMKFAKEIMDELDYLNEEYMNGR